MEEINRRLNLLGEEKIERALLKLGIPTMIGMVISALYNIVDAFFIGQLGTLQMAAVSVVFPIAMMVTGLGLLFGSGAGSYLARLLGSKAYEKVNECTSTAIITGIIISSVCILGMLIFFEPLMKLLGDIRSNIHIRIKYGYIWSCTGYDYI